MIDLNKKILPVYSTGTNNHKVNNYILTIENSYSIRKKLNECLNKHLNNKAILKTMKQDIRHYINNYSDNFIINNNQVINLNIIDYLSLKLITNFLKSVYPHEKNYILNMVSRYIFLNLSDFKL